MYWSIKFINFQVSITWLNLRPLCRTACIKPKNNHQYGKLIQCYMSALHEPLSQHDIKPPWHKLNIFWCLWHGTVTVKYATLGMRKIALSVCQRVPAWTNTNNNLSYAMHYHLIEECQPLPIIITSNLGLISNLMH